MQYSRALTTQHSELLKPRGPLHGLLPLIRTLAGDDPFALDLQLRGRFGLSLYHGLQVLVSIKFDDEHRTIKLACNGEARTDKEHIPLDEPNRVLSALAEFLPEAILRCQPIMYSDRQGGYWINRLSLTLGQRWQSADDWLVFDRDAFVEKTYAELVTISDPVRLKYERLHAKLAAEAPEIWGEPDPRGFGYQGRCDLLALGSLGELLCIKVMHGTDERGFQWKVLEAAMAAEVFRMVEASTLEAVRALITQKVEIGLLPPRAVERTASQAFPRIVPVLVVVDADNDSPGWKRLTRLQQENPGLAEVTVVEVKDSQALKINTKFTLMHRTKRSTATAGHPQ